MCLRIGMKTCGTQCYHVRAKLFHKYGQSWVVLIPSRLWLCPWQGSLVPIWRRGILLAMISVVVGAKLFQSNCLLAKSLFVQQPVLVETPYLLQPWVIPSLDHSYIMDTNSWNPERSSRPRMTCNCFIMLNLFAGTPWFRKVTPLTIML